MSAASPENQIHLSEVIIQKLGPNSPPELAQMTNVNVLDLHKDFANETKIYDKNTNTVYVYSNASKIDESTASSASPELHQQLSPQQMHQVVINQHPSDLSMDSGLKNNNDQYELMQENGVMLQRMVNDHLVEGRLVQTISDGRGGEQQILTKISTGDDSLFRFIESNQLVSKLVGENQQIISRDIINGEHHIITRNENGEHILTRIVNTGAMDHGKMNGEMFNATLGSLSAKGDDPKQIIYTTQPQETNGGVIKSHPESYDNLNPDVQKQIDLIYEDGNKTVIYTTSGNSNPHSPEPKGMEELYSSGECLNGTQVIVQGNLQYTPQIQPDGSTVYVVSELVSSDLNGQR